MINPRAEARVTKFGDLILSGRGFEIGVLDNNHRAFANRNYTWFDVPQKLRGWRYTRTAGGVKATITITGTSDTTLYVATAPSQTGIDLTGWEKVEALGFRYTDKGRTRVQVYRRDLPKGKRITIPQGNWSGGLVLLPPAAKPPAK